MTLGTDIKSILIVMQGATEKEITEALSGAYPGITQDMVRKVLGFNSKTFKKDGDVWVVEKGGGQ